VIAPAADGRDDVSSIDSFNVFLVALTAFVGFTTSLFSRRTCATSRRGKLTPRAAALPQHVSSSSCSRCCWRWWTKTSRILWVRWSRDAHDRAAGGLYRTPASLEAAWKYFILCGVGIAQALFGTVLLFFAAERVIGGGATSLLWTHLNEVKGQLEPTVLSLAFVFLLVGYGTKVAWRHCTTGCRTRMPRARRPFRPCSPACF
jgi:hydrogenase-4 component F